MCIRDSPLPLAWLAAAEPGPCPAPLNSFSNLALQAQAAYRRQASPAGYGSALALVLEPREADHRRNGRGSRDFRVFRMAS
eukprot:12086917-Alexandrium_andersonii.AAC.1